jgi:DnaD/phage-associated family protein
MSVKIMGMVWDLTLDPNKKFVLLAYADHANHDGGNIWPAVETIVHKTGYHERSVQRVTRSLQVLGYLVDDGKGPKGTNKWRIPLNNGGDKIAPLANDTKSLGDIPSGGILPPDSTVKPSEEEGSVFRAFETNIGPLTQMVGETLGDLIDEHSPTWVMAAIREAALNGKRSIKYIQAILDRWKVDGYGTPYPSKNGKNGKNGHHPASPPKTETPEQKAERIRIAQELVS